jgi:hypothetical protein
MTVPRNRVFDVFLYLIRTGSVLCVLDAVDEAVPATSLTAFLDLFAEVAQTLSAESTVVLSSRYSFLADSPQVRRLLNNSCLISERLVQQLHANRVDPLELPHFSIVRLNDLQPQPGQVESLSPLELRLARQTGRDPGVPTRRLTELVTARVEQVLGQADVGSRLDGVPGLGFLSGRTVFSLMDLFTGLSAESFRQGRVSVEAFLLAPLFRSAGPDLLSLEHTVFGEYFAARYLRTPEGRATAADLKPEPLLTEQVRRFLHQLGTPVCDLTQAHPTQPTEAAPAAPPQTVPAGVYLVGASHRLLLRTLPAPVLFDQFPVTVARYKQFLAAVDQDGCAQWDHPDTPAEHTHDPWLERLRDPTYYSDPTFDDYPAICVSWWSAYAFAGYDGKRLPTCVEWEAAGRGTDGRLFPWGDTLDLAAVNCADVWSGRPLVTYEAWKQEIDHGPVRHGAPTRVSDHPSNVSPFGVRGMAGNVWEWTSTVFDRVNSAAICGGSYDNPYRAVQASSKALYVRRGHSNAVGFRCLQDLP